MKLQSVELVSRYTQSTARTLLIMSSTGIAINLYGLNAGAWTFFDRKLQPNEFREIATAVLLFGMTSHLINWLSDRASLSNWFHTNKIPMNNMASWGVFESERGLLVGLEARLGKLTEQLDDFATKSEEAMQTASQDELLANSGQEEHLKTLSRQLNGVSSGLTEISGILSDLGPKFRKLSRLSRFVIYVWHLIVPVVLALLALFLFWQ